MALKWNKKILVAAVEAVYGQDQAPTGANAMLVKNLQITPMEGEYLGRDLETGQLGNELQELVGLHVIIEFDVEMAGSGTANLPVAYAPLFRACALSQDVLATPDRVEHGPISEGEESVTTYFNIGIIKHPMFGCRGSMGFKLNKKGYPEYHFKILGLWGAPTDTTAAVPDFSAFQRPRHVSNNNTPTFTLHGYAVKVADFSFQQNNVVFHEDMIGLEEIEINDRAPSAEITIQAPETLAEMDFFAIAKASTLGALQCIHGTLPGHITQHDMPQVQIKKPEYVKGDGNKTMLKMGLSPIPTSAGDDEYLITTR